MPTSVFPIFYNIDFELLKSRALDRNVYRLSHIRWRKKDEIFEFYERKDETEVQKHWFENSSNWGF